MDPAQRASSVVAVRYSTVEHRIQGKGLLLEFFEAVDKEPSRFILPLSLAKDLLGQVNPVIAKIGRTGSKPKLVQVDPPPK